MVFPQSERIEDPLPDEWCGRLGQSRLLSKSGPINSAWDFRGTFHGGIFALCKIRNHGWSIFLDFDLVFHFAPRARKFGRIFALTKIHLV
jgi:hypothetical protein